MTKVKIVMMSLDENVRASLPFQIAMPFICSINDTSWVLSLANIIGTSSLEKSIMFIFEGPTIVSEFYERD